MKRKSDLYFFYLPLLIIALVFFLFSSLNRRFIQTRVESLVREQLQATAEILKPSLSHLLKEQLPVEEIFKLYEQEHNIYYMALLNSDKQLLGWRSRFEGYLPLSLQYLEDGNSWTIDSPAGKIFNHFSSFFPEDGPPHFLYLGYSLQDLEAMLIRTRRNFFLIFAVILVVGIVFTMGLHRIQIRYLAKENEVQEALQETARFREISAFTSGVAHEIKNPLNSLSLIFELLQKKAPSELRDEIHPGKEEIHKISRILDQFSDSLKPLALTKEKIFMHDLMQPVIRSVEKEGLKEGVKISYFQENPVWVEGDERLLSQAILNLIKNSLEATEKGEISIRVFRRKKTVVVQIRDQGVGISPEDVKKIFDPFFTRKKSGMGIGLYITKKIIEAHEGKIELSSDTGLGTTFKISMPGG